MSGKAGLLAGADAEFEKLKEAFEGLSEAQMDASHADFKLAAAAVPDDCVAPGKTAHRIVDLNSRHHYEAHRGDIAAWRKSKGI
jgi:hypothetical protein